MSYLTVKQLKKACDENKYILARLSNHDQVGMNCKVANIYLRLSPRQTYEFTRVVSYTPCNFQTYISHKSPFIV